MDDNFQTYVNRLVRMTLPEAYKAQAQNIHISPKFQKQGEAGEYEPVPFPGYTIITPAGEDDTINVEFYHHLMQLQQQIAAQVGPDLFIPLPPESFHLTLADLIWNDAYHHANANPEFQSKLRDRITESFQQFQARTPLTTQPNYWQAVGLILMPRALGIALVPKSEETYLQVVHLRRAIYQNSGLIALGIEQQYHFTGHITLGYFGEAAGSIDRQQFGDTLTDLNQAWLQNEQYQLFQVTQAELRKFDDMTRYYRNPDWPTLAL